MSSHARAEMSVDVLGPQEESQVIAGMNCESRMPCRGSTIQCAKMVESSLMEAARMKDDRVTEQMIGSDDIDCEME